MNPRITTLIPAAALLLASTSLAVAQSSTTSEQDSGQPVETTQSSPESGSGVNAEADAESGEGESEKEDYAGDEEGAELGEAFDDDAAHSAEEGAKVEEEDDIGAAEETEDAAEDTAESVEDTAEDAAESVEETAEEAAEGADDAMDEALDEDEAESSSMETPEDDSVDISQLRPLEGDYEGVTLSNGMNAEDVAGAAIVNQEGDEVARVDDLLANQAGEVQAVLAKAGGILGIGAKELAIELSELSPGEDGELVTSLTEEDIEDMPEYEAPEDME
ncbi:MAG: PRC-barrel domain-containing protein [Pseudomonadota bacterium]